MKKGLTKGLEEGNATLVLRQLRHRFGLEVDDHEARILGLRLEQLEQLGEDLLDFRDLEDLKRWLDKT